MHFFIHLHNYLSSYLVYYRYFSYLCLFISYILIFIFIPPTYTELIVSYQKKNSEETTELEAKKQTFRSIAGKLGKTLKDNPAYRAKELALHEKELAVRRNEANN